MRSEKVNSSNLLTFAKCFKKLEPMRLDGGTVLLCSLVKYHTKGDGTQFFHDPELLPRCGVNVHKNKEFQGFAMKSQLDKSKKKKKT